MHPFPEAVELQETHDEWAPEVGIDVVPQLTLEDRFMDMRANDARVVDPPRELSWSGRTMGIRAIHTFRLQPSDGGTLARSEESWEGLVPTLLKGYSRRALDRGIRDVLRLLKDEAERRAGA